MARRSGTGLDKLVGLLVTVLVVGGIWWYQGGADKVANDNSSSSESRSGRGNAGTDPDSGLPFIRARDLPTEGRGTLELIDEGGPFPYDRDGITFENREEILPDQQRGYYEEYTVETPGSDDRGARRIVAGDGGEFYWTQDHYNSFERIAR
jgi:ribonuclease T1